MTKEDIKILLIAIILGAIALLASPHVGALEQYKQSHVTASALFGFATAIVLEDSDYPIAHRVVVATLPGCVRDLYDTRRQGDHKTNGVDLASSIAGGYARDKANYGLRIQASPRGIKVIITKEF